MTNYQIQNDKIIIDNSVFDARAALYSGQVFRVKALAENKYLVPSGNNAAIVTVLLDKTEILTDNIEYFINYFDLNRDYREILDYVDDVFAKTAIGDYPRLKVLKQDKFETVIDFIMSANNNIKRFSKTLDKIAERYGEKKSLFGETYYAFPQPSVLKNADPQKLQEFGCGYRAPYVLKTSGEIADGFDLNAIKEMDTLTANKYLQRLLGIGEKVADCILLFAFDKTDAFPVDTWIEKVYRENYGGTLSDRKKIREFFVSRFGKYSGIVQQYLFYYKREK